MRKIVIPIILTAIIAAVILWSGQNEKAPVVDTHTVTSQTVERTIKCNGVVESAEYRAVLPSSSCVVKEVMVQVGDVVKKGDTLFTVDLEATRTLLVSSGKVSAAAYETLADDPKITSPINGIVTVLSVTEGLIAEATKNAAVIAGTDTMQVAIKVPETLLKDVWIGQSAVVRGDGFNKDAYTGTVTFLSATAQATTGRGTMLDATVELKKDELDESLRLGLTAKIYLLAETFEEGMVIPYSCLQADNEGEYVLAVEEGIAVKKRVDVEAELTQGAVIREGISTGDMLIQNAEQYTEGQAVTVA